MKSRKMIFGIYDYAAFLSFLLYASGSVIVPVALVSLSLDLSFSLTEGGLSKGGFLQIARMLPMVAAMFLSSVLAGYFGKRRMVGVAVLVMAVGLALSSLSPTYGILLLAMLIAGLGEGVLEGLATPFVEALHPDEPGRYINFSHAFWSVGVLLTVLISGILLKHGVSWRLLIGGISLLSLIPCFILLNPGNKSVYPESSEPFHWNHSIQNFREIVKIPRFWLFFTAMFFAGGGEFCLTFWSASYIQLHFHSTAWAGGFGTACFALGMVIGRTGWGYFIDQHHLPLLVIVSAIVGFLMNLMIPQLHSLPLLFVFLFFIGLATAPFWPSVQSHCSHVLPSVDTTMLFILLSCAGIPGCGFFTWLMGYIGNHFGGLNSAFYIVPICYLALAMLILFDKVFIQNRDRSKA